MSKARRNIENGVIAIGIIILLWGAGIHFTWAAEGSDRSPKMIIVPCRHQPESQIRFLYVEKEELFEKVENYLREREEENVIELLQEISRQSILYRLPNNPYLLVPFFHICETLSQNNDERI